MDDQLIETGEYMTGVKIPGCKPKEAVRREYSIPLPMTEPDGKTLIAGTVDSQTFTVEYKLRCFVKHASVFEIGQGNCIQFPIQIIHKPDEELSPTPFDMRYKPNAKTADFDPARDNGDCTFQITKKSSLQSHEPPSTLKMVKINEDFNLHRAEFKDRVVLDFENVPLPMIGDEGFVCVGFENGLEWPDHTEINNSDW